MPALFEGSKREIEKGYSSWALPLMMGECCNYIDSNQVLNGGIGDCTDANILCCSEIRELRLENPFEL